MKHGGVSVNERRRNRTIISINEKSVLDKEKLIDEVNATLRNETKNLKYMEIKLKECENEYNAWSNNFPHISEKDLLDHSKGIIQNAIDCYKRKFLDCNGDLYHLGKASITCKFFNPFFLIDATTHTLELLADGLHHFQYNKLFTVEFISNLKCELPLAKKHAEVKFD